MEQDPLDRVKVLTIDLFGTVLDLTGGLVSPIHEVLAPKAEGIDPEAFWTQWRARQRIEQYLDTILMLGHSGYLETCRRALIYCLTGNHIPFSKDDVDELMGMWQKLAPFEDVGKALKLLQDSYGLAILSNGDSWLLDHLAANNIKIDFTAIISVDSVGVFKPHPSVYRAAAHMLAVDPSEIMMVAAHSFDVLGARACGFRGAYVNRYDLPFVGTRYRPDIEVDDFDGLASKLVGTYGS